MAKFYVYGLCYKSEIFYIGSAMNPAKRLFQHLNGSSNSDVYEFIKSIDDKNEILIKIFDYTISKNRKVQGKCSEIEQYWVNRMIAEGHHIKNKQIKNKSKINIKYFKKLICQKK